MLGENFISVKCFEVLILLKKLSIIIFILLFLWGKKFRRGKTENAISAADS